MKKIFCLTIMAILCTFGVASAQQFPSVQIETQDGKTIDTKTLIDGKTPVIISFWSTTCKPCIKELDAISEQMIDWLDEADFRVVAVSVDDSQSRLDYRFDGGLRQEPGLQACIERECDSPCVHLRQGRQDGVFAHELSARRRDGADSEDQDPAVVL